MSETDWSALALCGVPGVRSLTLKAEVVGHCVIQMPDGLVFSGQSDTNENAALYVLQKMKLHYNRDFKITGEIDGKQVSISTCV